MGSPNQPVLIRMGRFGFGLQYTTQIKALTKKIRFLAKSRIYIRLFISIHFIKKIPLRASSWVLKSVLVGCVIRSFASYRFHVQDFEGFLNGFGM